jgi:hypothetical protein
MTWAGKENDPVGTGHHRHRFPVRASRKTTTGPNALGVLDRVRRSQVSAAPTGGARGNPSAAPVRILLVCEDRHPGQLADGGAAAVLLCTSQGHGVSCLSPSGAIALPRQRRIECPLRIFLTEPAAL